MSCCYFWQDFSSIPIQHMKAGDKEEEISFVIIPGNPGCIEFYEKFSRTLMKQTGLCVRGVSHTGHVKSPAGLQHPQLTECGLQTQIEHKLMYLREIAFKNAARIILIGHSIGSYMILQMLDCLSEEEANRVIKAILLFPTIERMSLTPNGKQLTPLLTKARWLTTFAAFTVSSLPSKLADSLISFFVKTSDEQVLKAVKRNLCDVDVANSCSFTGLEEMLKVKSRDSDLIERHLHQLIFYYGSRDRWCPEEFYQNMIEDFGDNIQSSIIQCPKGLDHAFVLNQSDDVALMVADVIKSFI